MEKHEIEAARKAIQSASEQVRLLETGAGPSQAGRSKACVLTKLDEARQWLAEFAADLAHGPRP